MTSAFNTNPSYLSQRLFTPYRPRIGANTYLNVNLLPDLLEYIKKSLTSQQLLSLSQYQLQTYITQLSIKEKVTESLESFVHRILTYIRDRKEFWMNANILRNKENEEKQKQEQRHQHQAIVQFQNDVSYIDKKIPQQLQKTFNNYKKRRIQPSFQTTQNSQFIDKSKQILKINLTNYSMMPAYVLREYLNQQKGIQKLVKYQSLPKEDKDLLHELQNCVEYFMMQQKPKTNSIQNMKRRQTARQRRLPAYLLQNCPDNPDLHKHIQDEIQAQINSKESHSLMQNPLNPLTTFIPPSVNDQKLELNQQTINRSKVLQDQDQSSQEDSQNQFYQKFHQQVSKRTYYDSRMFSKQNFINQSHNMIEIVRCLVFYINGKDQLWFQNRWRQQQEQRILRQKKKQEEQQSQQGSVSGKQQSCDNKNNQQKYGSNQEEKVGDQKQNNLRQDEKAQSKNQPIVEEQRQKIADYNQIQQESEENSSIQKPFKSHLQVIQIGIRKTIFNEQWKNPTDMSFKQLSRCLSQRFLSIRQIYFVTKQYITRKINSIYQTHKQHSIKQQNNSREISSALIDSQINLDQIAKQFKDMIQHPQHVKLSAFRTQGIQIPWDHKDYLLFLKGLLEFFFIPTNNRKIAQYMMDNNSNKNIQANHVKYVKGIYLKNMGIRIDRGESGGGKKGRMLGKTQFIEKDIEFFSMKFFDKLKKSKKKLRRRRFDDQVDAGEQADSAY